MSQYDQIIQAVHDRAVGAFEKHGEFATIKEAVKKWDEEVDEVNDEITKVEEDPSIKNLERLRDELIDNSVVSLRAIYVIDQELRKLKP